MARARTADDAKRIAAIRDGLELYETAGKFSELRILDIRGERWAPKAVSGYFDDLDVAAEEAAKYDGRGQVYVTLNPVCPGVEARARNRLQENPKSTTGDNEIDRRRRLLIDLDPKRPTGISATDEEHNAAIERARAVVKALKERGWEDPFAVVDSGNGVHLLYSIDLPNDNASRDLLQAALRGLDFLFGDDKVDVDTTVYNASRIVKVPGVLACKGDNVPDRPHRRSGILFKGNNPATISRERLQALADAVPIPERDAARSKTNGAAFDIEKFVAEHGISVKRSGPWQGGTRHILSACVFDPSHIDSSAVILQFQNGAVEYRCQHNSCARFRWADVREKFEPGYRDAHKTKDAHDAEPIEWDEGHPWPTLHPAALHGLAGEIVRALEPETEADTAPMLFTLLTAVGNIAGRWVRGRVQDDDHAARLFVTIVGETSSGAKGMSLATVRPVLRAAAEEWHAERVLNGFGSGEAIVAELAPKREDDPDDLDDDGKPKRKTNPVDPRLLVFDPEFARILTVNARDGSTQSMILRAAWDGGRLAVRRSRSKMVAPDSHVSIIGHITPNELRAKLTETDCTGGFGNRFLYALSRRSKKLPSGGYVDPAIIGGFAKRLNRLVAKPAPRVLQRTPEAEELWHDLYTNEPDRDGIVGALTARSAAQRLRLSVAYAILDGADAIGVEHLRAADACWQYSVRSVEYLFGSLRGDTVQDRLLAALRDVYPNGLTGAQQDELFSSNLRGGRLKVAREALERARLIVTEKGPPGAKGGRPEIMSRAISRTKATEKHGTTSPREGESGLIRVNPSLSRSEAERAALPSGEAADVVRL